jgi:WD40 repeat protein
MLILGFARGARLPLAAVCLFLITLLPGCGGEEVDFSKPTAKPGGTVAKKDPASESETKPAAPAKAPDQTATSDKPTEKAADAPKDEAGSKQPGKPDRQVEVAKPAEAPAALATKKIDFDEGWLANRDPVTAFSDDGSLVAVGGADGWLRMFDVGAGAVREVFRTQEQSVSQVIVFPDNNVVAAVTADRQLRLYSSNGPQGFDRYSQSQLATSIEQRGIEIHSSRVTAGAWQPQGRLLATAATDASIHLWEMPLRDAVELAAAGGEIVAGTDGEVRADPFNLIAALDNPGVATSIDWSADGRFLAAGTLGQISIWDSETGSLAAVVPVEELPPAEIAEKQEDKEKEQPKTEFRVKEVSDDDDPPPPPRNTKPEEPIIDQGPQTPPPGTLTSQVVITPRGELCGAFYDGSIRVWSLQDAARPGETPVPHTIFRHPSPVLAIAVDAQGERVACGCEDSNIWIWDVATGQELARFSGHRGAVLSLAFEASGERLFSTGADRAAKVWPLNEGKPGSRAAVEIPMASTAQELRRTLQQQLKTAERPEDRTRLRNVIRTLERDENSDSDSSDTPENSRISQLRAALREATSDESRETMRRDLLTALKEHDLVKQLTGTTNQTERERLKEELKELNRNGHVTLQLNSDQPVGRIAEIDRQFAAHSSEESQKSVLRDKLQDLLRETPIWPRTRKDTWSHDESHLLASLPTEFNFDASLRPVELALTADGLTLAAARESARLQTPKSQKKTGNGRRVSNDDNEDEDSDAEERRAYGAVRVWDVLTGTELRAWTDVEGSTVRSLQFSGSGDTVVTSPDLFAFRLSTGESRELARDVSLSAKAGSQFAAVGLPGQPLEMADAVRLVDLNTMRFLPLQVNAYEATVPAIALSNDGTTLVAAIRERARHRLVEYDAQTLEQRAVLEDFEHRAAWYDGGEPGITYVAFSHDDRYVVAYGTYKDGDYRLTAIQMANRKTSVIESDKPLVRKDSAVPFRFVGNRGRLVVDTPTGLNVVDMSDSKTIDEVEFKSLPGGPRLLTLSGDGTVAAFGDESGVITLRKLGQDQGRVQFQAHAGPVVGVAFSQGDRMLVTAGEENQIRIWSLAGFLHSRQAADPVEKKPQTGTRRNRR